MNTQTKNSLLLLLCSVIWGTAFVAQSAGSGMGAYSFLAGRSWLAVLVLIPTVLVFALISAHLKKKQAAEGEVKVNMKSVFPWFIPFFVAMSLLSSAGLVPAALAAGLKTVSKFLMVMALAAIGLNTSFAEMKRSGAKPMLHGFIISLLVVLVAITVEFAIGVAPHGTLV